jgi:hypothetical protein
VEAIDYALMFKADAGLSAAAKERILWLGRQRPLLEFQVDGLALVVRPETNCGALAALTVQKLDAIAAAVTAVEAFGNALTFKQEAAAESPSALAAVEVIIKSL